MLTWVRSFSDKELFAPFTVNNDCDYYDDLRKRYTHFIKLLNEKADEESIKIAKKYSDKVCEALRTYYKGNISSCHQMISNLVAGCIDNELAVSILNDSSAFPGIKGSEIQFFRARSEHEAKMLPPKEMLHLPFKMRGKTGNYRFSIPGVTSLYLANTSYGCWIEMDKPSEHDFYVSPIVLDGNQKIFNLAVMSRDCSKLNDEADDRVHCWIKLLVLMIATSYRVEEKDRKFRSEYIVSQSIMLACKRLGLDGVAYYSKRVEDERFAIVAVNLALFADYKKGKDYGSICEHMKVDDAMNYQLFKQLGASATYKSYQLRVENTYHYTNIGNVHRQYEYKDTDFYRFDEHLFANWNDKDTIDWGNALKK